MKYHFKQLLRRTKSRTGYNRLQANYDCWYIVLNILTLVAIQHGVVHLYMNFLAHAWLSFHQPEVMTGNMISDFVKGKARYSFLPHIQNGIELHRRIDAFTDIHPATKNAMEIFRPHYRLYSAPLTDIVYDHFLATDESVFSDASLYEFSQEVYHILDMFSAHLPIRFLLILPYMKAENWLYHYRETAAIHKSFRGLVRRSSFLNDADTAFHLLNQHYSFLRECYTLFFADVKVYAQQQYKLLVT